MRKLNPILLPLLLTVLVMPVQAADELLMGIFPRRSATQTTQLFTPLADYLSEELGRPVRLITAKDFASFWTGVEEGSFDIVHYNQYHYIKSAQHYNVIASNEEQGSSQIAGALYVRKDSGIDSIDALRGRHILFGGGPDAMMSHIVPRYLLLQAGLGPEDYTSAYASNPLNAVLAVFFRQSDAAGAGDVVIKLPRVTSIARREELKILARSEPIQQLPWAVRSDLPGPLQQQIQQLLITLGQGKRGRFVLKSARLSAINIATSSDYNSAREIIGKVQPGMSE